jgi:hypothetical protein
MKRYLLLGLVLLLFMVAKSQEVNHSVLVLLKSGYTMKGVIVEKVPNAFIKLKLKNEEIVEFKFSEINKIEIDKAETEKLNKIIAAEEERKKQMEADQKEQQRLEAERLKEEQESNKAKLIQEEREKKEALAKQEADQKNKLLREAKQKLNAENRAAEINAITANDYFFMSVGLGQTFIQAENFDHLVESYKYIDPITPSSNITLSNYGFFVDYQKHNGAKKNMVLSFAYTNTSSVIASNGLDLNFNFNTYAINIGNCVYQNKFIQSIIGTGYAFTESVVFTSVGDRTNVLCGKTSFSSVPIYLNLRAALLLKKIPAFMFVKPTLNLNFLDAVSTNINITSGIGVFLRK